MRRAAIDAFSDRVFGWQMKTWAEKMASVSWLPEWAPYAKGRAYMERGAEPKAGTDLHKERMELLDELSSRD